MKKAPSHEDKKRELYADDVKRGAFERYAPMKHHCEGRSRSGAYGDAITECWEAPGHGQEIDPGQFLPGQFWVGNGEYWSAVNFCPYCGAKAPVHSEIER